MNEERVRAEQQLDGIEVAIEKIRSGGIVIVVDDEDRENEGDLIMAAEMSTPGTVNFMATHGRGLVCVPMEEEDLLRLDLQPMVHTNTAKLQTNFTVSVDVLEGTTTGISASDRARTILALADPTTQPAELGRPGHVFPLMSLRGGVLRRPGHTEAATDLARLAGFRSVGTLCEILSEDGSMARLPELIELGRRHDLPVISIQALIAYRRAHEKLVERVVETRLPTDFGDFRLVLYRSLLDEDAHVALILGDVTTPDPVLVRVHSQCLTGDVLRSQRCDCGAQKERAMQMIQEEGRGVFVYMKQEGRGIGLLNKIKAYHLQDQGLDTVEANVELGFQADQRDYGIGAQILVDLGLHDIRLLTNNPKKRVGITGFGLRVVERVPLEVPANPNNRHYLETKRSKLGHLLDHLDS